MLGVLNRMTAASQQQHGQPLASRLLTIVRSMRAKLSAWMLLECVCKRADVAGTELAAQLHDSDELGMLIQAALQTPGAPMTPVQRCVLGVANGLLLNSCVEQHSASVRATVEAFALHVVQHSNEEPDLRDALEWLLLGTKHQPLADACGAAVLQRRLLQHSCMHVRAAAAACVFSHADMMDAALQQQLKESDLTPLQAAAEAAPPGSRLECLCLAAIPPAQALERSAYGPKWTAINAWLRPRLVGAIHSTTATSHPEGLIVGLLCSMCQAIALHPLLLEAGIAEALGCFLAGMAAASNVHTQQGGGDSAAARLATRATALLCHQYQIWQSTKKERFQDSTVLRDAIAGTYGFESMQSLAQQVQAALADSGDPDTLCNTSMAALVEWSSQVRSGPEAAACAEKLARVRRLRACSYARCCKLEAAQHAFKVCGDCKRGERDAVGCYCSATCQRADRFEGHAHCVLDSLPPSECIVQQSVLILWVSAVEQLPSA